jgi:guanine nucleotide-binding protein alpha-1 subunit
MPRRPASPDPLNIVVRPPPDENSQQRAARAQAEAEALRISAEIDAQLDVRPCH